MMILRRSTFIKSATVNSRFLSSVTRFCSRASTNYDDNENERQITPTNPSGRIHLSPLLLSNDSKSCSGFYDIELVDDETWQVSAGLACVWRESDEGIKNKCYVTPADECVEDVGSPSFVGDSDFDELDNMRIRGDLFYKLDKDSKEYEEYSFDFHRRKKSSKTKDDKRETQKKEALKKNGLKEGNKAKYPSEDFTYNGEKIKNFGLNEGYSDGNIKCKTEKNPSEEFTYDGKKLKNFMIDESYGNGNIGNSFVEKKARTLTFNQLTAPYHEPFCLDIFISNASVRACVIHRVTSKVVAVAHSISKDIKFDLGSTRNVNTCAAVGGILAQRALADDIHDVVYTPRKGDKLEGKLQIVLQAVINNGVNVNVKLKQRKTKKGCHVNTF